MFRGALAVLGSVIAVALPGVSVAPASSNPPPVQVAPKPAPPPIPVGATPAPPAPKTGYKTASPCPPSLCGGDPASGCNHVQFVVSDGWGGHWWYRADLDYCWSLNGAQPKFLSESVGDVLHAEGMFYSSDQRASKITPWEANQHRMYAYERALSCLDPFCAKASHYYYPRLDAWFKNDGGCVYNLARWDLVVQATGACSGGGRIDLYFYG